MLAAPLALVRAGLLAESDTFWEVRTGLAILESGHIPATDRFSWTMAGRPWRPNSWAFDVLVGLAYRIGGLTGVAVTAGALILVVGAALVLLAHKLGAPMLGTGITLVLGMTATAGWLSARPQLIDYAAVPMLVVLMLTTGSPRSRQRIAAVVGVGALQAAWVNLHVSATLGSALAVLLAVACVVEDRVAGRPSHAIWRATAACVALVATLASPYGWDVFGQALRVRAASAYVIEWRPLEVTDIGQVLLLTMALAAGMVAYHAQRYAVAAALAALCAGGVLAIRLLPVAALLAVPVLATAFRLPGVAAWVTSRATLLRLGLGGLVLAMVLPAAVATTHLGRPGYATEPIRALPAGCRLFNGYLVGGPVILLRPDVPVSIDSRTDLYGADRMTANAAVIDGRAGSDTLRQMDIGCVLIDNRTPLARQLESSPTWHRQAGAGSVVLFVLNTRAS